MEGMIGEIRIFAGNFAPRTWAFCEGQLLPISQNTALFSILGTTYGGDGRTTFALPDMRGRAAIHAGNGPGLSDRRLGSKGGVEHVILNSTQIPSHSHSAAGTVQATITPGNSNNPNAKNFATSGTKLLYNSAATNLDMADNGATITVGNTGGNQQHENRQPWLAIYYIICLQGVFPSRS